MKGSIAAIVAGIFLICAGDSRAEATSALEVKSFIEASSAPLGVGKVRVRVRAIRATDALQRGELDSTSVEPGTSHIFSLDPKLTDLREKLGKLEYHSFKLLTQQTTDIPIKRKQTLTLVQGQTLTLRPLYIDGQKIGLWLKWMDPTGANILDTRLHFDGEHSMLTGTEAAADSGIILAIDVGQQ